MQSPRASKEEMGPLARPTAASAEAGAAANAAAMPDDADGTSTDLRPTPKRPSALSAARTKAKEPETAAAEEVETQMGACLHQ